MITEVSFKIFDSFQECFTLFSTDGAAYCLKAGQKLSPVFRNVTHVACTSHAIHLSLEDVRKTNEKAKNCIEALKSALARCGIFIAKKFDAISNWVSNLETMVLLSKYLNVLSGQ